MNLQKILITGASGCVGQYICKWLLENSNSELFLLLRDPDKLRAIPKDNPRIKLLIGDLRDSNKFKNELSQVNRVIHTATAWGDPERARQVNIVAVKNLLNLLDNSNFEQLIYFSTASILNKNLELMNEAFIYGTEYIQTKAQCLKELENHPLAEKIVAVFPTLVFGGSFEKSNNFPTSYLTKGLIEANKWIGIARWISIDSSFHFIHAEDIAYICGHLVTSPHPIMSKSEGSSIKKIVMGQKAISLNEAIQVLRRWLGIKRTPRIPLGGWLIELLLKVLPIQITP